MVTYIVTVYVAAGVAAMVGLLAAAAGPWGLGALAGSVLVGVTFGVERATRRSHDAFESPDVTETEEERTAYANLHRRIHADSTRPTPIIWS